MHRLQPLRRRKPLGEWTGKHKNSRRLYCSTCGHRFSERHGSLLEAAKLPEATVVRIIKCLEHGCSVEVTADICDVDPRTVERLLRHAGRRAKDFHHLQLARLRTPPEAVQLDELHGRVSLAQSKKGGHRGLGRVWVHAGLAVVSRFLTDLRIGPRDLETAKQLVASVALCGPGAQQDPPLLLIDNHLPYPAAILEVFGLIKHGRRRHGRGRREHPRLKPPPGPSVGVVDKVRDPSGRVVKVRTHALFGRLRVICQRVVELGIGWQINTAHLERLNGTVRGQQARLARRVQRVSRGEKSSQWSLWLWRDLYNWVRVHGALGDRTPAMAQGLAEHVWSVSEYIRYPVHVGELDRAIWRVAGHCA